MIVHWPAQQHYSSSLGVRVTLEFLEFPEQFFPWSPRFSQIWPYYHGWSEALQKEAATEAQAAGWEADQPGGYDIGYFGESYRNKYGTVWVRHLPRMD